MQAVVISDSHINPAIPNIRDWEKLGEYCVKNRPDYIIHLGDVADLSSLAHFKAQRGLYTTEQELTTVIKHLKAFEDVIKEDQDKSRRLHHTIYKPRKVLCLGNHDVRSDTNYIEPIFDKYGWDVYDFLQPFKLDDILFVHYMMKGLSDSPCTTPEELLENWHSSVMVGHSHQQGYAESYNYSTGKTIRAIKCPVFNRDDIRWAAQTRNKWSRGFTVIDTATQVFQWRPMECLYL